MLHRVGVMAVVGNLALVADRTDHRANAMGSVEVPIDDAIHEGYTFRRFDSWVMGC